MPWEFLFFFNSLQFPALVTDWGEKKTDMLTNNSNEELKN